MNKYCIMFCLAFSCTSFAADQEEKKVAYDASVIGKFYLSKAVKETKTHALCPFEMGGCALVSPIDITDCFFLIIEEYVATYPKETRDLYAFLKSNGFVVDHGKISIWQLFKAKLLTKDHSRLKKFLEDFMVGKEMDCDDKSCFIGPNSNSGIFHEKSSGIFFRNKNRLTVDELDSHLLNYSPRANELLIEVKKIGMEISRRLIEIRRLLNESADHKEFLDKLPDDLLPEITVKSIKKNTKFDNLKWDLLNDIKESILANNERVKSIDFINATPIDIMLLYSFFHIDESRTLTMKDGQLSTLSCFGEDDKLSVTNLLRPLAYEVLEELSLKVAKKKKKKKGKKKKVGSPSATEDAAEESPEEALSPEALPSEIAAVSAVAPATLPPATLPQVSLASAEPKGVVSQKKPTAPVGLPMSFVLRKEHRLLDTIARLLTRELSLNVDAAGSLSVALINDNGQDKLAIALKHTRSDVLPIIKALNNIVFYSERLAGIVSNVDVFIDRNKAIINQADKDLRVLEDGRIRAAAKSRIEARQNIDKIKLIMFIQGHASTVGETRLQNLFNHGFDESNVVLAKNVLNYHSEIAMADFLIDGQYELGQLGTKKGGSIKFQYIGNSIKMCSKCTGIINGGKNIRGYNQDAPFVIFFAGSYNVGYPSYMVPERALKLNRCDRWQLSTRLDSLGRPSKSISLGKLILEQNLDVSDSEEEHKH